MQPATLNLNLDTLEIIDIQPLPGEYVHCKDKKPVEAFGETVDAFHTYHAQRMVVSRKWNAICECCNHRLRYCHVAQDDKGQWHCFGRTCLSVKGLGEEAARKLEYSERIDQKEKGFCATFNSPPQYRELATSGNRPAYVRAWKAEARTRRGASKGGSVWKITVWGDSFEQCLANCMALSKLLGIKLS